jgi:hypothetical protein
MALSDYPTVNGILQTDSTGAQTIVIEPGGAWSDLPSTWEEWNNYNVGATTTLYWITEPAEMTANDYFNIETTIDTTGTTTYTIWTSGTGAFAGEETETVVNENDVDINAFYGQFAIIGIKVEQITANGPVQINSFSWKTTGRTLALYFNDYNSTDLNGSIGDRSIFPQRTFSVIKNVQITPKSAEGYVVDDYVDPDYFEGSSGFIVANIKNKFFTHFSVGLYTSDGNPTEGTFDAVAQVLPEQYADGANLRAR